MPQVGGQQRQLGVDVGAGSVPPQEGIHGETVPQIVNPWRFPLRGGNAALLQQGLERASQARAAISPSTPRGVPNEGHIRRNGKVPLASSTQIAINLIRNAPVDRKQEGVVQFRLANVQSRFLPVVITYCQLQQFPTPDSRREQQDDCEADGLWAQW